MEHPKSHTGRSRLALRPSPGLWPAGELTPVTRAVLCLLLYVLWPLATEAVDTIRVTSPDPMLEDWRWTVFDAEDGLAGNVRDLYDDGDKVWIATTAGAQCFDGFTWTTYTTEDGLVHNIVNAVIRDRDGAMWFGTAGGISRLVVSEAGAEEWTSFTFDGPERVGRQGLLQDRDGSIWAGFSLLRGKTDLSGYIRRFENGTWSEVDVPVDGVRPIPHGVRMLQASDGVVWFSGMNGILSYDRSRRPGAQWTFEPEDGLTYSMIEAANGDIWNVVYDGVVMRFSGGRWTRFSSRGLGISSTSGIWEDTEGTIWISGKNRVAKFRDERWVAYPRFDASRKFDGNTFGKRFSDGTIWLSSVRAVIRFQTDRRVSFFTFSDSLHVGPEGPDGSVWFWTPTSVIRKDHRVWLNYTADDGFLDGRVISVARAADGSIWAVGKHQGSGAAARFRNGRWSVHTEEAGVISDPYAIGITPARNGDLWVAGSHNGSGAVSRLSGGSWERFNAEVGHAERLLSGFEASDGSVWFSAMGRRGSGGDTIYRFDPTASAQERWQAITNDHLFASSFGEWPTGTLWVGTGNGVHRLNLSSLPEDRTLVSKTDLEVYFPKFTSFVPTARGMWFRPYFDRSVGAFYYDGQTWQNFRKADGLVDDGVRHIFRTTDGGVWIISGTGLSRYDRDRNRWTRYTAGDGIRIFPRSVNNVTEARDGSIWMDVDGEQVMRLDPFEPPVPETYLKPVFDEVSSAGNILIRWSGTTKWNQTSPDELTFRWRLDGSEWTETEEQDVTFTSLAAGEHTFEVYAVSPAFRSDVTPAVHAFIVEAPWWQDPRIAIPMLAFLLVGLIQTGRVVRSERRLRSANEALSDANNELFRVNREISAQSERKSAFLASMSHELRTPMNAIKGFTNLVMRRSEDVLEERQLENLRKVDQASDHLLAQINDLLDLSKIEAGRMDVSVSEFDVREAIEYCVSTVSPLVQEGVELSASIDASVGTANTDEQRVRQMVINLLSNAVKFTDAGSVCVRVTQAEQESGGKGESKARVQSSGVREGGEASSEYRVASAEFRGKNQNLVISVSDTGKGIPEEEIPTLFDEYRQVAGQSESEVQRGTGLGLSITKRFAELLGGSIEVESKVGEGSVFTVRIPGVYGERN